MEEVEIFTNIREFKKKFKSGLYICSWCKKMSTDPYICINCGKQSNLLFSENTYKYQIKTEHTEVQQIFKPIELEKGE